MYNYAIVGAGKQGEAIAYYLTKFCEASSVTLVETNFIKGIEVAQNIRKLLPKAFATLSVWTTEGSFDERIVNLFKASDAVISALPGDKNRLAAEAALKAGVSFCDLGFDEYETAQKITQMDATARENGISLVFNCGVGPGTVNIISVSGARETGCDFVKAYIGGNPFVPANALKYEKSFHGLLNEYIGNVSVLENGRVDMKPALSGLEEIYIGGRRFEAALLQTSFGFTAKILQKIGVKNAFEKTLRLPGHYQIMEAFAELGFLGKNLLKLGEGSYITPLEFTSWLFDGRVRVAFRDFVEILVIFEKEGEEIKRVKLSVMYDQELGFTAMQRSTASSTAAVAHALAHKKLPPGAYVPEQIIGADYLFSRLREMGFKISVT